MRDGKKISVERVAEIVVLAIFSLYGLNFAYILVESGWSLVLGVIMVLFIIVQWVMTCTKFLNYEQRTLINSIIMMVFVSLYCVNTDDYITCFPTLFVMMSLVSLYGKVKFLYITGITFIAIYGHRIMMMINAGTFADNWPALTRQISNIVIFNICLIFWLKAKEKDEDENKRTIKALRSAERIKDDFMSNVSHELRTPLNSIFGMSEMIQHDEDVEIMHSRGYAIQTATRNLIGTVSDILDFTELQTGNLDLEEESYDVISSVNDTISMVMAKKENKNVEFIVDFDINMPKILEGDDKKIRRIVMNIVSNAIKFTKDGYVKLSIGGRREKYGWNLMITVEDTGIGISPENIEKIFSQYNQADTASTRFAGGIGLGLAITRALVKIMSGTIMVESELGKGSKFQVVIPQKIVDESHAAVLEEASENNLLFFINSERTINMTATEVCFMTIKDNIDKLYVKKNFCRGYSELKKILEKDTFSHIFVFNADYSENPGFFDDLSMKSRVYVAVDRENELDIQNPAIRKIYKPIYSVSVINALNEDNNNGYEVNKKYNFIAPKAHILIVDDNVMNLKVICGILEKYQIKCTTATSGDEALALVDNMSYDFILMDYMMPEKDGIETLKEIRNKKGRYFQTVPVAVLTANAIAGAREKYMEAGFADFIEKPIELSILERVLKRNLPSEKIIPVAAKKEEITDMDDTMEKTVEEPAAPSKFEIGDLDIETAKVYCGDEKGIIEILKEFCNTAMEIRGKIISYYEAGDWTNYKIHVHGLKSSMKCVGANKLSELAKALEHYSAELDFEEIRKNHPLLIAEFDRVAEFVSTDEKINIPLVKEKDEIDISNLSDLKEDVFSMYISDFENAAYNLDDATMKVILEDLKKYEYKGTAIVSKLDSIERKVSNSDYFSALEELSKLKQTLDSQGGSES